MENNIIEIMQEIEKRYPLLQIDNDSMIVVDQNKNPLKMVGGWEVPIIQFIEYGNGYDAPEVKLPHFVKYRYIAGTYDFQTLGDVIELIDDFYPSLEQVVEYYSSGQNSVDTIRLNELGFFMGDIVCGDISIEISCPRVQSIYSYNIPLYDQFLLRIFNSSSGKSIGEAFNTLDDCLDYLVRGGEK